MPDDYVVLFGFCSEHLAPEEDRFIGDEMIVDTGVEEDGLIPGKYRYESEAMFGSSTTTDGRIYFDTSSRLVALTKVYDQPKATSLFMALDDALPVAVRSPPVNPNDQHELYIENAFGSPINGFVVSFKEKSTTYNSYESDMGRTLDPESEAEERAKYSNSRFSEDMVHAIAEDAMEKEMYIWSADIVVDDETIGFSDPLRFTRVGQTWFNNGGVHELFAVARDAVA